MSGNPFGRTIQRPNCQRLPPDFNTGCCFVCGTALPLGQSSLKHQQELRTCDFSVCRYVFAQRESMAEAQFEVYLRAQRRMISARRSATEIEEKRVNAINQKRMGERQSISRRVHAAHPGFSPDNTMMLEIPLSQKSLTPLPPERLNNYRRHLDQIIDDAMANCGPESAANLCSDQGYREPAIDDTAQSSRTDEISQSLCGLCKGCCCVGGRDFAFLTQETVKRVLRAKPEWGRRELLEAYLGYMSRETITASCVNHGAKGCSLPRELRSDICNNYFCAPLRAHRYEAEEAGMPYNVIAVQRDEGNWSRNRYEADNDPAVKHVMLVEPDKVSKFTDYPDTKTIQETECQ